MDKLEEAKKTHIKYGRCLEAMKTAIMNKINGEIQKL